MRSIAVLALSGAVLILLLRAIAASPASIAAAGSADPTWLALATLLMIIAFVLSVIKWKILVHALGHLLTLRRATYAMLVSWPIATITPSRAGDLTRTLVVRTELPTLRGQASVLFDRLLDVQSLVILSFVGTLALRRYGAAALLVSGVLCCWLVGLGLVRHRLKLRRFIPWERGRDLAVELLAAIDELVHRPRAILLAGCLSLATWSFVQGTFYGLCRAFGAQLAILDTLALWPLATLIGLVPITLSGMGTRDLAFVAMIRPLYPFEVDNEVILLATVGYTFVTAWLFAVIGAPFAWHWLLHRDRDAGLQS